MIIAFNATNILSSGGIVHLNNILKHADPKKHNFTKIILYAPEQINDFLPKKKWIKIKSEKLLGENTFQRIFSNRSRKECYKENIDIIYNLNGINICKYIPNVNLIQNQIPFNFKIIFIYKSLKIILRFILLRALMIRSINKSRGTIFLSKGSQNEILPQVNIKSNYTIISHGVDKIFFYKKKPSNSLVDKKNFTLIYVSSFEPYKNHINLIKALKILNKD